MPRRRRTPPPSNYSDLRGGPTPGRRYGVSGTPAFSHTAPGHEDEGVYKWDRQPPREVRGDNAVVYGYDWVPAEKPATDDLADDGDGESAPQPGP